MYTAGLHDIRIYEKALGPGSPSANHTGTCCSLRAGIYFLLSTKMGHLVWSSEAIPVCRVSGETHIYSHMTPGLVVNSTPYGALPAFQPYNQLPWLARLLSLSLSLSLCPKLHSLYKAQKCCYSSTSPGWMRPSAGFLPKHCPELSLLSVHSPVRCHFIWKLKVFPQPPCEAEAPARLTSPQPLDFDLRSWVGHRTPQSPHISDYFLTSSSLAFGVFSIHARASLVAQL